IGRFTLVHAASPSLPLLGIAYTPEAYNSSPRYGVNHKWRFETRRLSARRRQLRANSPQQAHRKPLAPYLKNEETRPRHKPTNAALTNQIVGPRLVHNRRRKKETCWPGFDSE